MPGQLSVPSGTPSPSVSSAAASPLNVAPAKPELGAAGAVGLFPPPPPLQAVTTSPMPTTSASIIMKFLLFIVIPLPGRFPELTAFDEGRLRPDRSLASDNDHGADCRAERLNSAQTLVNRGLAD